MVPQRPECDKSGSNLEADSPLERAQFSDLLDALDKHSCHGAERPRSCEKGVQIASGHYAECVKSSTGLQGSLVAVRKASTGPRCSGTQLDAGKAEPGRQPRSLRCEGEPDSVSDIGKSHCDGQVVEVVQAIQKKKKDSKTIPVDESRLSQHLTSSLDATALSKLMPLQWSPETPPLPNEGINPSTQRLTSGAYNPYAKRNKLHPKIPSTTRKHQIDPIEEEMLIESTDTDMDPDFSDSDESTSTESQDSPVTQYPVWHRPRMGTFGIFCTGKKSMLGGGSGGPSSYKRGGIAPQRFRQVAGSRAAQA
ncbi:hypothetical protein AX16_008729 [Volvariella volvacea WC 439]|nr:hypothetical protein AX16_008729 [Volvariella volvacea WC 439]